VLVGTAQVDMVYLDASGSSKAVVLHTSAELTVAEIAVGAYALAAIVASITSCVLVRLRIKYTVWEDTVTPAALGSSLKRRAVFFFRTGDTSPLALIEIPSPLDSIFLTDGPTAGYGVDLSNSDVSAFVSELIAESATNGFGDAIIEVDTAYLQSRV
jgi:hypothetical protein